MRVHLINPNDKSFGIGPSHATCPINATSGAVNVNGGNREGERETVLSFDNACKASPYSNVRL